MLKKSILSALILALIASPIIACSDSDSNDSDTQSQTDGQKTDGDKTDGQKTDGDKTDGQKTDGNKTDGDKTDGNKTDGDKTDGDKNADFLKEIRSSKPYVKSDIKTADLESTVKGQYDLNFDLLRNSADQLGQNNAMISTFSIQSALAMAWAGAKDKTAESMKKALHFDDNTHKVFNKLNELILSRRAEAIKTEYEDRDAIDINITNDMYFSPDHKWAESWLDILSTNYNAGLTEMNFKADPEKARKYINDAISSATHDRIQDILPDGSITVDTKSVLTNAIYFKAPWKGGFFKATQKLSFNKLSAGKVDVDHIEASGHFPYMKSDQYQVLDIALRDDSFNILMILPEDGEFESVQTSLSGDEIKSIMDKLETTRANVDIPIFTFKTSISLKKPLQALGMDIPFDPKNADFSGMTEDQNDFFIDEIYHKTFMGLDENGIEAAAATAVVMAGNSSAQVDPPVPFVLDRPFFFVVYEHESHTPMFVGRVMDPSAGK
ncbi:MAG: serpin family protein [Proteobacteria bacterium]|nr:serpin family protein [Pseudomonadota bacterium]